MMLTVGKLKDLIKSMPDETPIVLQADDEGNSYRYANDIEFNPVDDDMANYFGEDPYGDCRVARKYEIVEEFEENGEEPSFDDYVLVAVVY